MNRRPYLVLACLILTGCRPHNSLQATVMNALPHRSRQDQFNHPLPGDNLYANVTKIRVPPPSGEKRRQALGYQQIGPDGHYHLHIMRPHEIAPAGVHLIPIEFMKLDPSTGRYR